MSLFYPRQNPLEQSPPLLNAARTAAPLWNGKGKDPVGFWLLENSIHWYGIHVVDGRPIPCLASVGKCLQCDRAWRPRQTGFICALRDDTGGRYLLRITEYAYRHCPVLALAGVKLRGLPLIVKRMGETKQAPWSLEVSQTKARRDLPYSVDTVRALGRIWGVDLARLASCPPLDGDVTPLLQAYKPREGRNQ